MLLLCGMPRAPFDEQWLHAPTQFTLRNNKESRGARLHMGKVKKERASWTAVDVPVEVWVEIGRFLPHGALRALCAAVPFGALKTAWKSRWKAHLAQHLRRTRCISQRYPIQSSVRQCVVAGCTHSRAYMVDLTIDGETFMLLREGPYCWNHRPSEWDDLGSEHNRAAS